MTGQVVPVKINAEKEGVETAKKYKVSGFPTILFINSTGEVEGTIVGYKPADGFSQDLTKFASAHKDLPALEARYKSNPDDAETAERLASIYAGRGKAERAEEVLAKAEKADPDNAKGHLAEAYNALGDHYQENQQFDKAIPLFQKAAKTGKKPYDVAYANISIAACYFEQQRPKDAIPALEATLAVKDGPKDLLAQAQQMLNAARQQAAKQ